MMATSAIHKCQQCGFETDVGASLDVFEHDPHCGRCGLSASEGEMKMQEELATLMRQHLTLTNNTNYQSQPSLPPTPPQRNPQPQITYITQHYHHSAHQAGPTHPVEQTTVSEQLARHGIDASILFPSQINLFTKAQPEQQLRLIQLWSITPSSYGNQLLAGDVINWTDTPMQQEEEAAPTKHRSMVETGHYSPAQGHHAEPYIVDGYATLPDVIDCTTDTGDAVRTEEYKQAFDPAYQSREWWVHESHPVENQYGMLQQMKQLADQDHNMS